MGYRDRFFMRVPPYFSRFCFRYSVGLMPSTRWKHWEK